MLRRLHYLNLLDGNDFGRFGIQLFHDSIKRRTVSSIISTVSLQVELVNADSDIERLLGLNKRSLMNILSTFYRPTSVVSWRVRVQSRRIYVDVRLAQPPSGNGPGIVGLPVSVRMIVPYEIRPVKSRWIMRQHLSARHLPCLIAVIL